jgi:retron-type reverse transcriptase
MAVRQPPSRRCLPAHRHLAQSVGDAPVRRQPGQRRRLGTTFEQIESAGLEDWLTRLGEELRTKTYRCQPVRRVIIPKPGSGERPLGIPTIRDRVVQTAAKLVLKPIFEADLDPAAHGYRPGRGAGQAIQTVLTLLRQRPLNRMRSPRGSVVVTRLASYALDRLRHIRAVLLCPPP